MPSILLHTQIKAPLKRVFDLSRSIDLHMLSVATTKEKAIAGVTTGLINLNESVTWRAQHFGIWWNLSVIIEACDAPFSFTDTMTRGIFKSMKHRHSFATSDDITLMTDHFYFESPAGFLGRLFNNLVLTQHLKGFLMTRNNVIKRVAEGDEWKKIPGITD